MLTIRLIFESLGFAFKALKSNLLRTILSLLGVTIGIFSIIAVLTLVDSLEKNIRDSFNFLGSNVIYVGKWPFTGGSGRDWWKDYVKRPNVAYSEYKFLKANMKTAKTVSIYAAAGNITAKAKNSSINQLNLRGAGVDFDQIFEMNIINGRYLTNDEIEGGRNVVILGFEVANSLFPKNDPIGQQVKIRNLKFNVVGVLKREGESFIGTPSNDFGCIIPYESFRKL